MSTLMACDMEVEVETELARYWSRPITTRSKDILSLNKARGTTGNDLSEWTKRPARLNGTWELDYISIHGSRSTGCSQRKPEITFNLPEKGHGKRGALTLTPRSPLTATTSSSITPPLPAWPVRATAKRPSGRCKR